jgi:hypothetical protein
MIAQVRDVVLGAGKKVIDAKNIVSVVQELLAEVGAEKAGAAGD